MSFSYPLDIDGDHILIEVERAYGSEETGSLDQARTTLLNSFDKVKSTVAVLSAGMVEAINSMSANAKPDEFEVEFGIKFSVDGTVFVAAVGTEATLSITLTYKRK